MPHVLVAGALHPSGIALLDQAKAKGVTYDYVREATEISYVALIDRADALVIRTQPLSAATIQNGAKLKIVSRHGVGYDAIDVKALTARRIPLAIVGDVNSRSVAEHALFLLLACAKKALRSDRAVRDGRWKWRDRLESADVYGKRLLIIGYGRAGRHLARMASSLDMEVVAFDPYLAAEGWPEGPARPAASLHNALATADYVSINIPKTERPFFGRQEFALMKPGVVIVNTARGGIVDEAELVDGLRSGRIAAAGLDVFETEPPATNDALLQFDQVVLSPHVAGLTRECGERMAIGSVQNVLDFFQGRLDQNLVVNGVEAKYRPS